MKNSLIAPVFLAAAGVAFGQTPSKGMSASHRVEVVSVDTSGKSITVLKASGQPSASAPATGGTAASDKGPSVTLKVDDAASASLSGLKAGDVVTITCGESVGSDTGTPPGSPSNPGSSGSSSTHPGSTSPGTTTAPGTPGSTTDPHAPGSRTDPNRSGSGTMDGRDARSLQQCGKVTAIGKS